jgi:hypothetical protein
MREEGVLCQVDRAAANFWIARLPRRCGYEHHAACRIPVVFVRFNVLTN